MGQCHGALGAIENARRGLSALVGSDEAPVELTKEVKAANSIAAKIASLTGNGS